MISQYNIYVGGYNICKHGSAFCTTMFGRSQHLVKVTERMWSNLQNGEKMNLDKHVFNF